ncbi:MAG: hypothetical protein JWL79_1179 [Frankiales bacterium]|nr:hypothetical protein [Frankiales bacterium]
MQRSRITALAALTLLLGLVGATPARADVALPHVDPFYRYTGSTPLAQVPPGTVLKTRPVTLAIQTTATPLPATQLLYRTADEVGRPTVTVTTVITPPGSTVAPKIIAYLSFYDSLSDKCDPSYTLQGGDPGPNNTQLSDAEQAFVQAYAATGSVVTVPDFEGEQLHWTAGHESGYGTLDAVRATESFLKAPASTMVGLTGYSGGSIAADWAAELAPRYAPGLNIVGVAAGGVPVHFAHNLRYIDGSAVWSGIIPAVLHTLASSYGLKLDHYLSAYGKELVAKDSSGCIGDFSGTHPGLKVAQLLKPQYRDILAQPEFVAVINKLIMGTAPGHPKGPFFMGVGNNGSSIGDDIMVTKDVEALAHEYCGQGVTVQYVEYANASHTPAALEFEPAAVRFLVQRFAGLPFAGNCSRIGAGNSLAPLTAPAPPRQQPSTTTSDHPTTAGPGGQLASTGGRALPAYLALLVLTVAAAIRRPASRA